MSMYVASGCPLCAIVRTAPGATVAAPESSRSTVCSLAQVINVPIETGRP